MLHPDLLPALDSATHHARADDPSALRSFVRHAATPMALFDRGMRYLEANAAFRAQYGLGATPLAGRSHYEVFPDIPERWREVHRAALAGTPQHRTEDAFDRASGTRQWVDWEVVPWHAPGGHVGGIVLSTREAGPRREQRLENLRVLELLQVTFERAPTGIALLAAPGCIERCNPAFAALLAIDQASLAGRPLGTLFCGEAAAAIGTALDGLYGGHDEVATIDCSIGTGDGTRWLHLALSLAGREEGAGPRVVAVATDLTQRHLDEQRLREERGKLRGLFELSPLGIALSDMDGRFVEFNDAFCRILGYPRAELTMADYRRLTTGTYRAQEDVQRELLASTGRYGPHETEYRRKDGTLVPLRMNGALVAGTGGQPCTWSIIEDITDQKANEQRVRDLAADLAATLQAVPDLLFDLDEHGTYHDHWAHLPELLAAPTESLRGRNVHDVLPESAARGVMAAIEEAGRTGHSYGRQVQIDLPIGPRWFELSVARRRTMQGQPARFMVVSRDVTERRQAETRLRLAAGVFANSYDGIMLTDADNRITDVNPAFERMTGYSREEVLGRNPRLLSSGRQGQPFYENLWSSLQARKSWSGEIWNRRKDGQAYAALLSATRVTDEHGETLQHIGVFSDITALKQHEAELDRVARYDPLTGVANRRLLAERLGQAVARRAGGGSLMAVCHLDLDGFRPVNERHGHEVGDQLLVGVTEHLRRALRPGDTLARVGGDEFVVLLDGLGTMGECRERVGSLLEAARRPVEVQGCSLAISASIGVTVTPPDDREPDTLLRHADQAMYSAKEAGRNTFHLYDPEADRRIQDQRERRARLRGALERGELRLHFQPKVNLRTREVVGAEALIRWQHPQDGLLAPGQFLECAEGTELELAIGEWVVETALAHMEQWMAAGRRLPVSVNVGAYQLMREGFPASLRAALARHPGVPPGDLEIEILESAALGNTGQAGQVLAACHALGVQLALDDFGTGYSSLAYFRTLPVDHLKIDRSFVRDMLEDPSDLDIVESVVRLAHAFNRRVVAEGIETPEHAAMLLRMGCTLGQGYGIARPMPADALEGWRARWDKDTGWLPAGEFDAREELPLRIAARSHDPWINRLVAALEHPESLRSADLDPQGCNFGRWHQGSGASRYGHLGGYRGIAASHDRLHECALRLLAVGRNEGALAARSLLPALFAARDDLAGRLLSLERMLADAEAADGGG